MTEERVEGKREGMENKMYQGERYSTVVKVLAFDTAYPRFDPQHCILGNNFIFIF